MRTWNESAFPSLAYKSPTCIIVAIGEKRHFFGVGGGGLRHGFLLSASLASPLASALNAALLCRNADKNVICVILHIHY